MKDEEQNDSRRGAEARSEHVHEVDCGYTVTGKPGNCSCRDSVERDRDRLLGLLHDATCRQVDAERERDEAARLQMELDGMCNAEELRQARAEVARLRDMLKSSTGHLVLWSQSDPEGTAHFLPQRIAQNEQALAAVRSSSTIVKESPANRQIEEESK